MKLGKSIIAPTIICALTTVFTNSCSNVSVEKLDEKQIVLNKLQNDEYCKTHSEIEKIMDYRNATNKSDNFIVIDKNNCTSVVYNSQGDTLYINEVLLGKSIGDNKSIADNYTPAGEFTIVGKDKDYGEKNTKLYSHRLLPIIGDIKPSPDKFLALHQIPSTVQQIRSKNLHNNILEDNRVTNGCVNYSINDYDNMISYIKGDDTNVYILPEEKDNFLKVIKSFWGNHMLKQDKY